MSWPYANLFLSIALILGIGCRSKIDIQTTTAAVHSTANEPDLSTGTASAPFSPDQKNPDSIVGDLRLDKISPAVAKPGTTVRVSGENFVDGLTLVIDGVEVQLKVLSPTEVRFVMPAGTSSGRNILEISFEGRVLSTGSLLADNAGDGIPLSQVPAEHVCTGITFRNERGALENGSMSCSDPSSDCITDGEQNCRTHAALRSAAVVGLSTKVALGEVVAGVSGSVARRPEACTHAGNSDCVIESPLVSFDVTALNSAHIRSGVSIAGIAGSLTIPLPSDVQQGVGFGAQAALVGTLDPSLVPPACTSEGEKQCVAAGGFRVVSLAELAPKIVQSASVAGVAGLVRLPPASEVVSGISYGAGGNAHTGSLLVPATNDVQSGVQYGSNSALTGVYLPSGPPSCQGDGEVSCVAGGDFAAVDVAQLAVKLLSPKVVAGVSGTVLLPPVGKVASGVSYGASGNLSGALSLPSPHAVAATHGAYGDPTSPLVGSYVPDFPDRRYVWTGDTVAGLQGSLTLPAADQVHTSVSSFGIGGIASSGALTLPAANKVLSGVSYGIVDSLSTGTLVLPAAQYVLASAGTYGNPDAPLTASLAPDFPEAKHVLSSARVNGTAGTLTLPDEQDVFTGQSYGQTGHLKTGSLTLPAPEKVHEDFGSYGRGGNGSTPTLANCSTDAQIGCVTSSTFKAAEVSALIPAHIKRGVVVAGVEGQFPSAAFPLPRYIDSGTTAEVVVEDGVTTPLTNFATQLKSDASFEFWDASGKRHVARGDDDLVAGNVRDQTNLENLSLIGSYLPDCTADGQTFCATTSRFRAVDTAAASLSPWDLRLGKVAGGVTGKIRFFRNTAYNSLYNRTSGAGASSGLDVYDTVDDWCNGNAACGSLPSQTPGGWLAPTLDHLQRDALSDTNTDGACSVGEDCVYRDLMTGQTWTSSKANTYNWEDAISFCHGLNAISYGGYSTGWRLATAKELMLININGMWTLKVPLALQSDFYWAATTMSSNTANAWRITPHENRVHYQAKSSAHGALCTR